MFLSTVSRITFAASSPYPSLHSVSHSASLFAFFFCQVSQSATPSQSERQQLTWLLGFSSFELITSSWKPAHFSNAFLARVWSCWLSQSNISGSNLRLTLLQKFLRMPSGSSRRSSASITQISTPSLLALAES